MSVMKGLNLCEYEVRERNFKLKTALLSAIDNEDVEQLIEHVRRLELESMDDPGQTLAEGPVQQFPTASAKSGLDESRMPPSVSDIMQQELGRLLESAWNNEDVDICIQLVKGLNACDTKVKSKYIRFMTGSDNIPEGEHESLLNSILRNLIHTKSGPGGTSKSKGISPAELKEIMHS